MISMSIGIADILGKKYRCRIDICKRDIDPPLRWCVENKFDILCYVLTTVLIMDEFSSLIAVPDHPFLHILSFLKYSDLAAYVKYLVSN